MKKILIAILIFALMMTMAACGGSEGADQGYEGMADNSKGTRLYGGFSSEAVSDYEPQEAFDEYDGNSEEYGDGGDEVTIGMPRSIGKDQVKLIYTADLNVQTLDYDEAVKGLKKLVDKFGGYFESISSDNGSYYSSEDYRYGTFTVRVPSDKYQDFVNSVSEGMHVVNMNQNAQDVGQQYFEVERRLETLNNKHDRLEELLKKATKMSDIIELESALSDTEYEIEQYSTDLLRYDSLVNYSTVYVNIEKVSEFDTGIAEELSFGERLMRSISQGASNFGWWLEDLINWIGYHAIQIVILIVIVVAFVKLHLVRRVGGIFKSRKPKQSYEIAEKKEDMK
ncbi:MAG: DUF4349 domain-containing protein [Firmicutes bacterium]|nr:DUF4349 domain-containing protein [Bacillota bacterium]